ncbi:MAG: hypothetical protein L6R42_010113 [Xanthoria sp. 1 TBL-2021]|nr:MAG: hypothetical protein L6R42_010113 [Xanthoria sp. 1 TBL-2021]
MDSLPSFWDPNASSAKYEHHATTHNVNGPTATASMQSKADSRETPALLRSNNIRTSSENPTTDVSRPQPGGQACNVMNPRYQGPSVETSLLPSAHGAPSRPTRLNGFRSGPTGKTNPKPRTSIFGNLGRNRKDPGDTTRSPNSSALPQPPNPIQSNLDAGGVSTQRPSNPRASTAASISTQDASEPHSQTDPSSTGDNMSILGEHQSEYSPLGTSDDHNMSHAHQDAKSFVSSITSRTSQETQSKRRSYKQPIAPSTITIITANQDSPSATDLLPSEANKFSGFCKGAWRLQIGEYKKALEERQRPSSMYSTVRFWQCKSCKFEGRLVQLDRKTKDFDQQIMLADGIQFRWVFLFKSHVECKDVNPNPLRSTFGCMFCCAEGRGTPVFRGAKALMDHMQEHRIRLPLGEVLYRMNALVGEKAPPGADFDINLDAKEGLTI